MSPTRDPRCTSSPEIREVADDAGTRGIEIVFHVATRPDALLELLWDVSNFPKLFPDIKEHTVLPRAGDADADPDTLDVAYRVNAVVKEVRYVLRRTVDRERRAITWHELSGDLKRVRGGWWVEATDAPTVCRATYRAFVDIGRFVPTRLVAKGAKRKAGEMVERVRRVAGGLA